MHGSSDVSNVRRARRPLKVEVDIAHLLRLRALKLTGQGDICEHIDAALDLYFAQRSGGDPLSSVTDGLTDAVGSGG